jgi:hypothetical protein
MGEKYLVLGIIDASVSVEVEADSPAEAAAAASTELDASICHQCSRELNLGDIYATRVIDKDGDQVWTDEPDDERPAGPVAIVATASDGETQALVLDPWTGRSEAA